MAKLVHEDYEVAWICPLEIEQIAASCMFDEEHPQLWQPSADHNSYTLGSIHGHNLVIAGLTQAGNTTAATVVANLRHTFPNVKYGLLVGIGGGVDASTDAGSIHLGHVVVSKPAGQNPGTIQYDHGKAKEGYFERIGSLQPPPAALLAAARTLAVKCAREEHDPVIRDVRDRIDTRKPGLARFRYPGSSQDKLYRSSYYHLASTKSCAEAGCDLNMTIHRTDPSGVTDLNTLPPRVIIHRGPIASGELVIKNGLLRDTLAQELGILCFEMEAAGVLNDFSCLSIRGISDYCDSHKNDVWHGFAAATAAAYARNLFKFMPIHGRTRAAQPGMREDTREALMRSLEFPQIRRGRENIEDPFVTTCQWIFEVSKE